MKPRTVGISEIKRGIIDSRKSVAKCAGRKGIFSTTVKMVLLAFETYLPFTKAK